MASFDHFKDMYDIKIKPRMLRRVIRKYLPDEKQPLESSFELAKVVSAVQTHNLLSESVEEESMDNKLMQSWTSAVDEWENRVLLLISSNMPDKCSVGICLLGLTCQECSSSRFLSSYSTWFQKILSNLQPPADSQFVKVASCTSLSDLLTRLGRFSNVKNEGTSHSGKLIQPVLKLINEDSAEAVWDGAVSLLNTIITFFPASIHHYYEKVEAAIVSKVLSGNCSPKMLKKLGHCLASLPKSRGDEDSWCLMMQKILILINGYLNDAFQGLEDAKSAKVRRLLVPNGKDPPPPLGGHTSSTGAQEKTINRSSQLLTSSVSTLMTCCCKLLTSPYPVQVTVPIRALLSLIERVLMVNGSCPQKMLPFMTALQQELICLELPVLHVHSLDLLVAVIKGMRGQLLPHAAKVVRLVTKYFKGCALPELRIKLYSITRIVLISMGVGMAIYLAQDVIDNASADLNPVLEEDVQTSNPSPNSIKSQSGKRKRKNGANFGTFDEQLDKTSLEVGALKKHKISPISLKIAALEALEALLTVGGVLGNESWRTSTDNLLMIVASHSCKGGWANEENDAFLPHVSSSTLMDFQLAALRALLASLLSPARSRPPFLAQGLDLFRRGKQEAGTKIAGFCAYALLTLEVLIHPRALALDDFPALRPNSSKARHSVPELDNSDDDFLLNLKDSPENLPAKNIKDGVELLKTVETISAENPSAADAFGAKIPEISEQKHAEQKHAGSNADGEMRSDEDQIMVESTQIFEESVSTKSAVSLEVTADPRDTKLELGKAASDGDASFHRDHDMAPASGVDKLLDKVKEIGPSGISWGDKSKDALDDGSDVDSLLGEFPDIVDEDSDSESV